MPSEQAPPDHVVVVGGGLTGLVAAYRLSQAGSSVTVIEPDRIGGKLQTSMVAGRAVDEGADAFLLRVPWAVALCHDLDIDGELTSPASRSAELFVGGTRRPFPQGHVLGVPADLDSLAATGLLSAEGLERVRADLELPADPGDPALAGTDVAIGPYLRRRMGDEVVDHLIDPLLGGINAGDTANMSLAAVVPQLDAAARSGDPSLIRSCIAQRDKAMPPTGPSAGSGSVVVAIDQPSSAPPIFATPQGGMARLIDALVALTPAADIRVGHGAAAVELTGATGGPETATGARVTLDDGTTIDADAVLLTTPAHVTGPLLAAAAPEAAAVFTDIDHSSVAMLTMAFDRADLGDTSAHSGCLVPRDQGTLVTAVSYATSKWAHLQSPEQDDVLLRVSVGRTGDERHRDVDDELLQETVVKDLDQILGVSGPPREIRLGRWDRCLPQYAPGHLDRIDQVESLLAPTAISVAGMALRGVGIPACVKSAEDAVAAIGARWPTRRALTS